MKAKNLLSLLISVTLMWGSLADFADPTGKITILPLSAGEKSRNYSATRIPDQTPKIVVFKGIEVSNNTNKDAVVTVINTQNRCSLSSAYFTDEKSAKGGDANDPKKDFDGAAFGFMMQFFEIVEYTENNGFPGFQLGQENVTGRYNLSDPNLKWNFKFADVTGTGSNNKTEKIQSVIAETSDQVFSIRLLITGSPASLNGREFRPDQAKFDFEIKWFDNLLHVPANWTTGPSNLTETNQAANQTQKNTTQVALIGAYGASTGTYTRKSNTLNNEIEFNTTGNFRSFFRWSNQANVTTNGTIVALQSVRDVEVTNTTVISKFGSSFVTNWVKKVIAHSFDGDRASDIILDTEFGLNIKNQTSNKPPTAKSEGMSTVIPLTMTFALLFICQFFF